MAGLTIRNLDDEFVEALRKQAKANNRSLEDELRVILTRAARGQAPEDFLALADRIAAMTPPDRPQTDSTELIREDRKR